MRKLSEIVDDICAAKVSIAIATRDESDHIKNQQRSLLRIFLAELNEWEKRIDENIVNPIIFIEPHKPGQHEEESE